MGIGFPALRLVEDQFAIAGAIVKDQVESLDDVDQRLTAGGKIVLIQFPLAMARDGQPPLAPGPWDCRLLVEGAADHPGQGLLLCCAGGPVLTEGLIPRWGHVWELEGPGHSISMPSVGVSGCSISGAKRRCLLSSTA